MRQLQRGQGMARLKNMRGWGKDRGEAEAGETVPAAAPDTDVAAFPPLPASLADLYELTCLSYNDRVFASCISLLLGAVWGVCLMFCLWLLILFLLACLSNGPGTPDNSMWAMAFLALSGVGLLTWRATRRTPGLQAQRNWDRHYENAMHTLQNSSLASLLFDEGLLLQAEAEYRALSPLSLPGSARPPSLREALFFAAAAWDALREYEQGRRNRLSIELGRILSRALSLPVLLGQAGPYTCIPERTRITALLHFVYGPQVSLPAREIPPGTYAQRKGRGWDRRLGE